MALWPATFRQASGSVHETLSTAAAAVAGALGAVALGAGALGAAGLGTAALTDCDGCSRLLHAANASKLIRDIAAAAVPRGARLAIADTE
jgi:hypothetical protein